MRQTYPNYSESGIEWVGEIPSDWDVKPLFTVAVHSNESNKGMIEDNLLSLSYGRIIQKDIDTLGGLLPESFETYQVINPDYMIFRLTDLQNDKRSLRSAIATQRGIITSAYVAVKPKKIEPEFFHYLMRAYDETKVFYNLGSGMRQSLKFDELKRIPLMVPSAEEQRTIVSYLNAETTRIDALINEKQQFIDLLKEKRQALISHFVTKGLDANVPMKDSGVEWIGEVPEHWSIKKLSYFSQMQSGDSITSEQIESEGVYPVFGGNGLRGYTESYNLDGDYALIGRQGALCGNINYASGKFWASEHAVVVYPNTETNFKWFGETLRAMNLNQYSQSAAQPGLSVSNILQLYCPYPPKEEQDQIAQQLSLETTRIDKLVAATLESIELLKEHRTALISAAVTGKIDVRGMVDTKGGAA